MSFKATSLGPLLFLSLGAPGCATNDLGSPPSWTLTPSSYEGVAPFTVTFTAAPATETDYTIKRHEWDFDADDTIDLTTGSDEPTANFVYTVPGEYDAYAGVVLNENDGWVRAMLDIGKVITVLAPE